MIKKLDVKNLRHSLDSIFVIPGIGEVNELEGDTTEATEIRPLVFNRVHKLQGVGYINDEFYLYSESGARNGQYGAKFIPKVPIKGVKQSITLVSFTNLLNFETNNVEELLNDSRLFNRINTTYGKLYIDDCVKLLSEENSKSFKSISVFGFSFSRQRLMFVFLFFCLLASAGLFMSVIKAKKLEVKIISNSSEEDVLFMLIENKYTRFFMWCISPLIIILPNLEFEITSLLSIFLTVGFLMVVLYLNIRSYAMSLKF